MKVLKTPQMVWERPIVLLDSGQSIGESVFLDKCREWIVVSLREGRNKSDRVWIIYPNEERHRRWHGAYPVGGYEKWHIRPVRWRRRPLDKRGFLASVAMFEEGCLRKKIRPPWRYDLKTKRRAAYVYLNPSPRDLNFVALRHEEFINDNNCQRFVMGEPVDWGFPRNVRQFTHQVWCYRKDRANHLREDFEENWCVHLPWWDWWSEDRKDSWYGRPIFGFAQDWGDVGCRRMPGVAKSWVNSSYVKEKPNTWESLLSATSARFYIVASSRESLAFDAMIAAARGATLIAPDVPFYRNLPGKHWLYPATDAGGGTILWNRTDVGLWVKDRLRSHGYQTDSAKLAR